MLTAIGASAATIHVTPAQLEHIRQLPEPDREKAQRLVELDSALTPQTGDIDIPGAFDKVGFVSAVDKSQRDFDNVDKQMKEAEPSVNEKRQQAGAPTIHYVGWAQPPSYDGSSHSVIWARDLRFSGQDKDPLNYDLRRLSRYGVLSLNARSTIENISQVRSAMVDLGSRASLL